MHMCSLTHLLARMVRAVVVFVTLSRPRKVLSTKSSRNTMDALRATARDYTHGHSALRCNVHIDSWAGQDGFALAAHTLTVVWDDGWGYVSQSVAVGEKRVAHVCHCTRTGACTSSLFGTAHTLWQARTHWRAKGQFCGTCCLTGLVGGCEQGHLGGGVRQHALEPLWNDGCEGRELRLSRKRAA